MPANSTKLRHPPIIESVLDIDCDLPPNADLAKIQREATDALRDVYPRFRQQVLSQHQISSSLEKGVEINTSQGLGALQFVSEDEKQLVQFRPNGFSFNRLAPYSSLDDYLPEIERVWSLFVSICNPQVCNTVRLRAINRIELPVVNGSVDHEEYLINPPRVVDDGRMTFTSFFHQYQVFDRPTGFQGNVILATQAFEGDRLPLIFDIETLSLGNADPSNWSEISGRIQGLREFRNLIFSKSLEEKCLQLYR